MRTASRKWRRKVGRRWYEAYRRQWLSMSQAERGRALRLESRSDR